MRKLVDEHNVAHSGSKPSAQCLPHNHSTATIPIVHISTSQIYIKEIAHLAASIFKFSNYSAYWILRSLSRYPDSN